MLTLVETRPRPNSHSKRQKKTGRPQLPFKPLSSEEVCQVNLATFREGLQPLSLAARGDREVFSSAGLSESPTSNVQCPKSMKVTSSPEGGACPRSSITDHQLTQR